MYLPEFDLCGPRVGEKMDTIKFGYYQENNMWVGWLDEYPDYRTQGTSLDELKENLKDLYQDLNGGKIPYARRYGELVVG
jgi:hypothetical protein